MASAAAVGVAVTCAVVSTGIAVRREWMRPRVTEVQSTRTVDHWEQYLHGGHRIGAAKAPVTIVEFADYECPYCEKFANGPLRYVLARYPDRVAVVFRQSPLSYHRFAIPAARAAECAATQGRFAQFNAAIYAHQDSLGLKSFVDYAAGAGVPDLTLFVRCSQASDPMAVVAADTVAARTLGVTGTPTLLIDGTMYRGVLDSMQLDKHVQDALARAEHAGS